MCACKAYVASDNCWLRSANTNNNNNAWNVNGNNGNLNNNNYNNTNQARAVLVQFEVSVMCKCHYTESGRKEAHSFLAGKTEPYGYVTLYVLHAMCPAANLNMYEIMYDFDNIREAYRMARRCRANSRDVSEFDLNRIYNLRKLQKQLKEKRWDEIFVYYRFYISEPKVRKVDALRFDGRIAQHVLCDNIIKPYMEKRLVKENAACREGKGTDYARRLVKEGLINFQKHQNSGYVLKIDIKKYFDSINHQVLKSMIRDFPDDETLEFIYYIIDHVPEPVGLPLGNQTSQWMALYYLNPLDRIIKEKYRIKVYARYMDDFIIVHESKDVLQNLLGELTEYAHSVLKLRFNSKTQITPLHKGFSFLGWKYHLTKTGGVKLYIEKGKAKEKQRKLHVLETEYAKGQITTEKYMERLVSHEAHLRKGCTYYFERKHILPLFDAIEKD